MFLLKIAETFCLPGRRTIFIKYSKNVQNSIQAFRLEGLHHEQYTMNKYGQFSQA